MVMSSNYFFFFCLTNSPENTKIKVPLYDSVEWLWLIGFMASFRQQMIGQVPSWSFTDRCEWRKSPDFCCLLRLSVGIKAPVLSTACRAKHQWNLNHFTFSNKVEREDVVVTTDGEAEFYNKHRSSRKEVLWRKVDACFYSLWFSMRRRDSSTVVAILYPQKTPIQNEK